MHMPYRCLLWGFFFVSVIGCTNHTVSVSDPKIRIVVDPSTPREALAPWLFYAGARAHWMEKKFFDQNPGATSYQYTFTEEIEARGGCAHLWREIRDKDHLMNRYLDDLITVQEAGFLREYIEYIWTYLRDVHWSQPESLRLEEFDRWRNANFRDHDPETRATAQLQEKSQR
jgi:hypothetical protein